MVATTSSSTSRRRSGCCLALALFAVASLTPVDAADPTKPVIWTAKQIAELEKKIASTVDPNRHLGLERLLDSATLIFRDGPSEAEVHETLADFITVRAGEGEVVIGGSIIGGKTTAPGELRGPSMAGGTVHAFAAGDMLYIPANTVHQFRVKPGKTFTVTIVKITPKP